MVTTSTRRCHRIQFTFDFNDISMELAIFLLGICFAVSGISCGRMPSRERRMIGGTPRSISEAKFMVIVHLSDRQDQNEVGFCNGAMIHSLWALTTAHCVALTSLEHIRVIGNISTVFDLTGIWHEVAEKVLYPGFEWHRYDIDFALLKLTTPINAEYMEYIGAVPVSAYSSSKLVLYSFGFNNLPLHTSGQLASKQIHIIPASLCRKRCHPQPTLHHDEFCVDMRGSLANTFGDMGGVILRDGDLAGILTRGCAEHRNGIIIAGLRMRVFRSFITSRVYGLQY